MAINYEEQLQNINLAITAIEGGAQEYRIGTRSVRRADLNVLYSERIRLENAVLQQSSSMCYPTLGRR